MEFLYYLAAGAATGVLSGLFGIGGGVVIVSILAYLFAGLGFPESHIMHIALGTSLASIVFTSLSSARAHHRKDNVDFPLVRQLAPTIVLGTLLGSLIVAQIHSHALQAIFAVFLTAVACQMLFKLSPNQASRVPGRWLNGVMGVVIGFISSLVGIGGGTVSVPYLHYFNVPLKRAIGTSAAIGLPIALAGTIGYIYTGWSVPGLPANSLGFIYLPALAGIALASIITAPWGAALAHRLPTPILRRLFACLLLALGLNMLWKVI
ncbi:sulfite exporter TauE/SafE family protein [Methylovorus glucosotrophus]|uniref:Probable membrane transporter protein n=1 Tax=Methylovorus glucosotrophus (strain SIP3-4) TaxID=582744 RepID=C6X9C3_METGS|nr:sulfite exporter TauE/SafE family protein [Methylovorus glucosotrophus]ACT49743.1 protein of unknown function DUF81 [Methylovorus glucosotrophus SIP3-4]